MKRLRVYIDLALTPDVLEMLREGASGHDLLFPQKPVSSVLAKAERDPAFGTVDVAFGQPDLEAIKDAGELKWIHVSSSGITRYDTPGFRSTMAQRRILVSNSASVFSEACAVHALAFMLAEARRLPAALQTRTASGTIAWNALRGSSTTLKGQSVLIVGYGAIGERLAEFLDPLGMRVLAYRRRPRGNEEVPTVSPDQLEETLSSIDHVVNILPESAETRLFFNGARFGRFKRGAIFYNIGRGATVDQGALVEVLRNGRLGAAWLDVTEPEPLPDEHPLWAEPNCFITPHVAGGHAEETKSLARHFLTNLARFEKGEPMLDRVM